MQKLNNHNITSCTYTTYVTEYTWSYIHIFKNQFHNFHIIYSLSRIHLPCSYTFFLYFIQDLQQISSNLLTSFQVGNKLIHT
ncbi:hypothetical protein F383_34637 [Gossypium arboreum]|uniref:Uncharacterized protein n=1 Tax=Gossypium arboreum TaxID=29729 RepID=A0A0B0N2E4_GOSAR|nr:hypothetical protein F383_34637 [Gossypium arboreum]